MDLERFIQEESDDDAEEFTEEEKANDPSKRILWAAENNLIDVVKETLASNPSVVTSKDSDLYTPLHRASYNNHADVVKLLLEHGADVAGQTRDGWQPLHSAARWNSTLAAQVLIDNGADINAQTKGGLTPLHLAASEPNNGAVLELLLSSPFVDTSLVSKAGETARQICLRVSPYYALFDLKDASVNCLKPKESCHDSNGLPVT